MAVTRIIIEVQNASEKLDAERLGRQIAETVRLLAASEVNVDIKDGGANPDTAALYRELGV